MMKLPLLQVTELKKYFYEPTGRLIDTLRKRKRVIKAVDGVSINLEKQETYGLVGESGSGKSTFGRTVLKLYNPDGGKIVFRGIDVTDLDEKKMKPIRRHMQIIFQNPYSSLNPRKKVEDIILDVLRIHGLEEGNDKLREILQEVELDFSYRKRYPHQLSGGERQRVAIARAMILQPELVVADEVTSSLDVSVQAQILKLLRQLQKDYRVSYLFISHDLSVVASLSHRIGVMYKGRLVEEGTSGILFESPLHPYTNVLMASIPDFRRKWKPIMLPEKKIDSSGCSFYQKCPFGRAECGNVVPELREIEKGHKVACHLYG
jgi:oligopeptide/dipeptide ABC transporter ATP-binding protein